MEIYLIGVLIAFIIYRACRYLELKYQERLGEDTTEWGFLIFAYLAIFASWIGVVLFGAILGIMISKLNEGKKPPKWL